MKYLNYAIHVGEEGMKGEKVKLEDAIMHLQDLIKRNKELLNDELDADLKAELEKQIATYEKKLRQKFRELRALTEKEREDKEREKEIARHLDDEQEK